MQNKPKLIAEVAQGYEGKPDYARLLVKAALRAGADAVKFQIVYADDVAQPGYQYYEFFKTLQMDTDVWRSLVAAARDGGIRFFCDISGERALAIAEEIKPDGIKIHSSNFFNRRVLERALEITERVFISLGGIHEEEIAALVEDLKGAGVFEKCTFLYGFQSEPTPIELSGLQRLVHLRARFPGLSLGYMDHTAGDSHDRLAVSAMAVALGVEWLEKHLTLDRFLELEDYVSALQPAEFAEYAAAIRRLHGAVGPAGYSLTDEELNYRDKSVKKIVAARELTLGSTIGAADIAFKRTPNIAPFDGYHNPAQVLGRVLAKDLKEGDAVLGGALRD